jgi:SAM-dependent methyltransferase
MSTNLPVRRAAPKWLRQLDTGSSEVLWNLRGLRRGWREYPAGMDFLHPDSPNFAWKGLQTQIYLRALATELPLGQDRPLQILDAACGIGRMLVPLARAGHCVHGIDACIESIEAAARHAEGLGNHVKLTWDDIDTAALVPNQFDRVLALELLCYLPDPTSTLRHLTASLKPGGSLVASVEAWPGALLSWPDRPRPSELARVFEEQTFSVPDDLWVHPMSADEFTAILESADLEIQRLEPIHFFADGPLADLVEVDRLGDSVYEDQLIEWEQSLRTDLTLSGLSRAWLAVARKKEE